MTSYDPPVDFDPEPSRPHMKHGSAIPLIKYGGPGSVFVKQVAFLVIVVKYDILTSTDLFF